MSRRTTTRRRFLKGLAAAGLAWPALGARPVRAQQNLNAVLTPIRAQFDVPALAAAFVRGESLVAQGTVGLRRREGSEGAVDADPFHLGSCTKSMTATVIGWLVERGKLAWDAPLGETLAELRDDMHPDYLGLTPVELLAHRTGMPGVNTPEAYDAFQLQLVQEFRLPLTVARPIAQQRLAFARRVLSRAPVTPPGTTYDYSNFGYIVAGAVVEAACGKSWEEVTQEELFAPLGMASADYGAPGTPNLEDAPWGHAGDGCAPVSPGALADNPPVYGPAGRAHAPLADWAKYASLHLRGARGEGGLLLAPETFQRLQGDLFGQGYALGWGVTRRGWANGVTLVHAGSNTLWHAVAWIAPQRNAALLAATNCGAEHAFAAIDTAVVAMIQRYL